MNINTLITKHTVPMMYGRYNDLSLLQQVVSGPNSLKLLLYFYFHFSKLCKFYVDYVIMRTF